MMGILVSVVCLFLGIGVLLSIHFCVGGGGGGGFIWGFFNPGNFVHGRRIASCYNRNRSNIDLEKLPCYDFKAAPVGAGAGEKEKETSNSVDCVICLENLKVGDRCRLLPRCMHSFHSKCIDSWLLKTPICPICRTSASASWKNNNSCMVSGGEGSSQALANDVEFELRESQYETQLSSDPSSLHNSPSESGV